MNRKKVKRQKINRDTQNDKDPCQEVLVLPPNLLEKLGINLGKMCVNQDFSVDSSEDIQNSKFNTLRNEEIFKQQNNSHMANDSKHTNEESSIIETANLMKKSVFLSPTFNTSQTVVLSNNLELDNTKKPETSYTGDFNQDVDPDKNVNQNNKSDIHDIVTIIGNKSKLCTGPNSDQSHTDIQQTHTHTFEKNNCETNNKTNISSEEVIDPIKFNTLRPLNDFHDRQALLPSSVNTFTSINKVTNAEKKTVKNNTCLPEDMPKEVKSTNENKIKDVVQTPKQIDLNEEILINNTPDSDIIYCKNTPSPHEKNPEIVFEREENISSDKVSMDNLQIFQEECEHVKHSMPIETDFISEIKATNVPVDEFKNCAFSETDISPRIQQNMTQENNIGFCSESVKNQDNTSVKNIQLDNVKTIANILSQHLIKDKNADLKKFEKFHSQEFFFTLRQNKVKSKLSVQGVEKPGGEGKLYRFQEPNIRTYARNKKADLPKRSKHINDYNLELIVTMDIDYKIEVDYSHIQYPQQFCICSDFGHLDHYTLGENYKHLHFWKSENNSSPKIMFSMYDDIEIHAMNWGDNIDFDGMNFEETPDSECNICCNVIQLDLDAKITEDIQFTNEVSYENKNTDEYQESKISSNINEKSKSICNNDVKDTMKESTEMQTVYYVIQPDGCEDLDVNIHDSERNIDAVTNIKKKRKISISEKSEAITDDPSCKKRTKILTCHICDETFAETELENHIAEEHEVTNDENINQKSQNDSCVNVPVVWEVPILDQQPKVEVEVSDVTCAVCCMNITNDQWFDHLAREHSYLAWEKGQELLDPTDESAVHEHLVNICNKIGELTCSNCFVGVKNVDSYLAHIRECGSMDVSNKISSVADTDNDKPESDATCSVKCAVCDQELLGKRWMDHIAMEHNYLAWKVGQPKLDLKDDEAIYNHLYSITKEIGGLKCSKCDRRRKYVKSYLQHVKTCDGSLNVTLKSSVNESLNDSTVSGLNTTQGSTLDDGAPVEDSSDDDAGGGGEEGGEVTCGVCGTRVRRCVWLEHAQRQHAYLAWRKEQVPLDISSEDAVYRHLRKILKKAGELVCRICNKRRRYVKSYMHHVEKCDQLIISNGQTDDAEAVKCGVCQKEIIGFQWIDHIAEKHNYLGWKQGQPALDPTDRSAVYKHLVNIFNEIGELTCKNCRAQKNSVDSYLRHVKDCGNMNSPKKIVINEDKDNDKPESDATCSVKCAVCDQELLDKRWMDHIAMEHNYLAWKVGQSKLDLKDDEAIHNHLYSISKNIGGLKCSKCGRRRKYVKSYLQHVQTCDGTKNLNESTMSALDTTQESSLAEDILDDDVRGGGEEGSEVTCGVCSARVRRCDWREHAQRQHAYLAWREGQVPLDISDEKAVFSHLRRILKKTGDLICATCNERRKYVKSYLHHVGKCDKSNVTLKSSVNDTLNQSTVSATNSTLDDGAPLNQSTVSATNSTLDDGAPVEDSSDNDAGGGGEGDVVTCGVCAARVPPCDWREHAMRQHAYLAWREGQVPLNLNDDEEVYEHLYKINRKQNGLKCNKCDITRKYVKAYLAHIGTCDTVTARALLEKGKLDVYECAICSEKVEPSQWKSHAMKKHYNVAWIVGESPIDVKNPFAVEKYLKEYKQKYNKLECMACGLVRVSFAGFYAHIIQCGKTDEETEMYKSVCDICNNKYLCIYKNQHLSMHREQENAKQRKLMQEEKQNELYERETEESTGRRRAAEKAKNVLEKYNNDAAHKCSICGFGADDENELKEHVCKTQESVSDEDGSAHFDSASSSDDDSFDSNLESDHSNNELMADTKKKKKKKHGDTMAAKITRIPFKVNKPKAFIAESAEDFCNMYFTSDVLFSKWRTCAHEAVSDDQLANYMPLVQQSCKVMFDSDEWTTYNQFEVKVTRDVSLFVGGSIQCISWAPLNMADRENPSGNFLAVACHRDSDTPRFEVDQTYRHSNMLQIWDFEDLQKSLPKLVMGIAHDYGTVWAMDWCPSGARDILLESKAEMQRLGLLAVACSSGSVYIFSVPYPSTIKDGDKLLYKFKPVAELRFSRGEREIYQATSVTWSLEKGHSVIIVGYADGMIAFYNVDLECPLLSDEEDGITIYYPYEEEQRHNSSITDLSTLPSAAGGTACVSSASQTGAALHLRGASVRSLLPATRAAFLPHWPAVMMAGNDTIVTQAVNELECWGAGRRLGSLQCWGGCWHCGAAAAVAPPALRLLHTHPAHADILRKDVAMIQMRPLDNKMRKLKNDGLAVKIEPTKFEDAVMSYGLEFKFLTGSAKDNLHQVTVNKEQCPERFPLADVTSMAFCPSAVHHRKLAVATHSGLIFLITV